MLQDQGAVPQSAQLQQELQDDCEADVCEEEGRNAGGSEVIGGWGWGLLAL